MKRNITAIIAAACAASLMSLGAYAQGPVGDAADGAGDVVENIGEGAGDVLEGVGDGIADVADGIGDAASDVLDGAGDAADSVTGGADDTSDPGDELVEITDDDDVEDDAEDDDVNLDYGKDDDQFYQAELNTDKNDIDPNPATGVMPFMTASAVAASAACVAYLTKKRNIGQ